MNENLNNSMILGLDVSTSIIGFSILTRQGNFEVASYIDLTKEPNKFNKIGIVKERLIYIKDLKNISKIFIEDRMQTFAKGLSSAQTLNYLHFFGGMVSLLCYQIFKQEPQYINPNTARKLVIGHARIQGRDTKQMVLDWAKQEYSSYAWEYTRNQTDKRYSYDIADAIVIARAGLILLEQENQVELK